MKIGALFAGYGGLDMGVSSVLDAELAWVSEIEEAPSRILAAHYPHAPNLGDVTKIDWAAVDPVDILTGGSPCQDLSTAGKRAGMKDGTRSGLWSSMCDAIETIRPSLVVWENVRGALSAEATAGDVESCDFCVGDAGDVHLRALGRVLGDLAELGYDAQWCGLRAADVGACHGRFRVFVLAYAHNAGLEGQPDQSGAAPAGRHGHPVAGAGGPDLTLLPTPRATDGTKGGPNQRGSSGDLMLPSAVVQLLPTPTTQVRPGYLHEKREGHQLELPDVVEHTRDWGRYEPAIRSHELLVGRPEPSPTEPTGRDGAQRLSPRFVEWMMGLPEGWVTDPAIGITRNEQLKALGNGVVPQQAAAAIRHLLALKSVVKEEA